MQVAQGCWNKLKVNRREVIRGWRRMCEVEQERKALGEVKQQLQPTIAAVVGVHVCKVSESWDFDVIVLDTKHKQGNKRADGCH